MSVVEKYIHHGYEVSVVTSVKGKNRAICLCWLGCKHFKPGSEENCEIAKQAYALCVEYNLTTPVTECPKYEAGET